jgi:hypothetical protein
MAVASKLKRPINFVFDSATETTSSDHSFAFEGLHSDAQLRICGPPKADGNLDWVIFGALLIEAAAQHRLCAQGSGNISE